MGARIGSAGEFSGAVLFDLLTGDGDTGLGNLGHELPPCKWMVIRSAGGTGRVGSQYPGNRIKKGLRLRSERRQDKNGGFVIVYSDFVIETTEKMLYYYTALRLIF